MELEQLKQRVKQGNIAPIYVLFGTQQLLMDECIKLISSQVLDEGSIDFNFERFNLSEQPIEQAIEAAETLPFLGDKRLVVGMDAYFLTGSKSSNKVEHRLSELERYVQSPVDYSVLILLVYQDKLDERKKVVKELKKKAVCCACSHLEDKEIIPWMKEKASQYQAVIEEDAAALLSQFIGGNLQLLASELSKMSHYVGINGTITTDVVHRLVSKTTEQDVFSLVDHVIHHRKSSAFEVLSELLKRNEEPIKMVFLLARQFRIILKVRLLDQKGYTPAQMASQLKLHPYVCKLAVQQGRRYSEKQLLHILDQLAEADYQMKTGQLNKELALEMFLLRI